MVLGTTFANFKGVFYIFFGNVGFWIDSVNCGVFS
jgi:hypothetical protein